MQHVKVSVSAVLINHYVFSFIQVRLIKITSRILMFQFLHLQTIRFSFYTCTFFIHFSLYNFWMVETKID